jgi:cytoskeletal protein CcmA (bactofilin family)
VKHAPPIQIIPAGTVFEGTLCWSGEVSVEGRLRGDALGRGRLEIGPDAEVHGEVRADDLLVDGLLEGDATAARRIELREGARVVGDLRAPTVVLAEGCNLEGRLEITRKGE